MLIDCEWSLCFIIFSGVLLFTKLFIPLSIPSAYRLVSSIFVFIFCSTLAEFYTTAVCWVRYGFKNSFWVWCKSNWTSSALTGLLNPRKFKLLPAADCCKFSYPYFNIISCFLIWMSSSLDKYLAFLSFCCFVVLLPLLVLPPLVSLFLLQMSTMITMSIMRKAPPSPTPRPIARVLLKLLLYAAAAVAPTTVGAEGLLLSSYGGTIVLKGSSHS